MAENYYLNHTATQIDAILTKVDGIAAGANVNVQVDWNQTTTTADDYIKNKPTIPDAQIQSDWNQTNTESKDFIKNKPTIPAAQVNSDWNAASGVAQILNKPTIPDAQIQSDWNQTNTESKDFIKNKPTIPEAQVQADWNQTTTTAVDYIKNKPTIPAAQVNSDWNAVSGVAQILNKPTLGTAAAKGVDSSPTASSTNLVESGGVYTAISAKADEPWQGTRSQYEALQTDDYEYYMVIETPNNQSLDLNSLSSFASPLVQPQANDYMNTPGLVDESDQVGETE